MLEVQAPRKARLLRYAAGDAATWIIAMVLVGLLRTENPTVHPPLLSLVATGIVAAGLQIGAGLLMGLYRGRYLFGTFAEAKVLAATMCLVGIIVAPGTVLMSGSGGVPRSTGLLSLPVAFCLALGFRFILRSASESGVPSGDGRVPVLLYGAGYLGATTALRMMTDRASDYHPVGFVDDDAHKVGMRVHGVLVLGGFNEIETIMRDSGAKALVICMSAVEPPQIRQITATTEQLGLDTLSLPPLNDILRGGVRVRDIRSVSMEDVLGRRPVELDSHSIEETIRGKRVLVTGAGGSIGSELCRQVLRFGPSELLMLDRDETGLQETQISITGHGLLDSSALILADIRDAEAMHRLMLERSPDVVFHAAALKHLPLLERYPEESWKSNVLGTLNVLRASLAANVPTFVNISTDKAADPTSFLGKSKRTAERLTAWAAETGENRRYMSVRFGNVIGSRGSMLPTFQAMIERGGPITVTDPNVTRFFMTIPEACQLVLQAGAIGRPGEVMILDMGEPVKILDIAQRMITMSGKEIDIVFTGLREGEKLHKDLIGRDEAGDSPFHPKIFHARVEPRSPESLNWAAWLTSGHALSACASQRPNSPFGGDADHADISNISTKDET